jgi:hypothetical protein
MSNEFLKIISKILILNRFFILKLIFILHEMKIIFRTIILMPKRTELDIEFFKYFVIRFYYY